MNMTIAGKPVTVPNILRALFLLLILGLVGTPQRAAAQDPEDPERRAELERRGAGLRVGGWIAQDLAEVGGANYSHSPHFEGWFQRGLDRHLAVESNLGVWRRIQESGSERASTFVVPLFTSLKFYPGTGPEASVQPFILGGGGLGLGIDDREGTDGGLLGLGGSDGTRFFTGLGFKGGTGVDVRLSEVFGLTVGGRYQWIRFDGSPGGNRTYKGVVVDAGLTYRLQY